MPKPIALIGECMLELTAQSRERSSRSLPMAMSYGGDTLNSAIYLARQGVDVDYVTALGDDGLSGWMLDQWQAEGVGCQLVARLPGAVPGLYLVEVDDSGERSFHYWRDSAPVRRLFDDPERVAQLGARLADCGWLCLSGITLAIFDEAARARLLTLLADFRLGGGKVIFDGNYRPRLWADEDSARAAYQAMYRITDIALPTLEDEQDLFGDVEPEAVLERLQSWGVIEIVLKMGERGCLVAGQEGAVTVPCEKVEVVDTTSAGDSFNAGYLGARWRGLEPVEAAACGHRLAGVVIQHRGAIIPRERMPDIR